MELLEWFEKNKSTKAKKLTKTKYFNLCLVGGVCFLTLLFAVLYVSMSKTVYFWDDTTYWDISRMLAQKSINPEFFKDVYNSIGVDDYNQAIAVPIAFWMKLFGDTRISYIIAIVLLYLIPSEIVIYFIAKKTSKAPRFAFVITLMLIPALWYITVIGFVDVAGVLIGLLCYLIYMSTNTKPYLKSVLLGILLVIIMIVRRYFAFFSVSFITAMIIDTILIKKDFKRLILSLVTFGVVLIVCFNSFFKNILLKDYGTLYSGYRYSFSTDLKLITRYFGTVFLIVAFMAVIMSAIKKKDFRGVFGLLQIIVCAAMFVSTQTHGQQHLLLYVPALVVAVMMIVNVIDKSSILIAVCIVSFLNFLSPCIKRIQPQNIQEIKNLSIFPSYSVEPQKRADINSILNLKRTLDKKIPEGAKCGVLASSFTLNSSILSNVIPSLNMQETREDAYIIGLPEVDSRDYWRLDEIYTCDYILAATPAQIHLAPDEQTIITEAVKSFSDGTDIAASFAKINDLNIKLGEIDVALYKRISDVTETAKTEFELRLFNQLKE